MQHIKSFNRRQRRKHQTYVDTIEFRFLFCFIWKITLSKTIDCIFQGTVFYENTMRSDASSNNAKFNRKSVISSHSTGSSNNEVNIWMKWKREITNDTKWNACHSINRQRVRHRQQTKTINHHSLHQNQPNNNCRPIIAHLWAAIRIFLWKWTNRKSILVRLSKCQHLVMETSVSNKNFLFDGLENPFLFTTLEFFFFWLFHVNHK